MSTMQPGDVLSYTEMCMAEQGYSLQRGMNFRVRGGDYSIILMSTRRGAPYHDKVEEDGAVLIYEGHDVSKALSHNPKGEDQPATLPSGRPTDNGKFLQAVTNFKKGASPDLVKVYEKIKTGIWVYNGVFELIDAWQEESDRRKVFKFKLRITGKTTELKERREKELKDLEHNRMIPTAVKLEVWKRDKGQCVICGKSDNLHFDHDLPFSKGGTSLTAKNIQLMCARHNLQKSDEII